jgi:hypothetical protein
LRLLFVAIALILRNVWVWLPAEVMAQPWRGARYLRLGLRLAVAKHDRLVRHVSVYRDLYERAQAFGIIFNY